MSFMPISTQSFRKLCLVLIVLGLVAAGVVLSMRVRTEYLSRAVDIVVDYNEVVALSGASGELPSRVLDDLKKAGVTAVALPEETLKSLSDQGEINLLAHPNAVGRYPNGWMPEDQVFQIETFNMKTFSLVAEGLARVYPESNLYLEPPVRILVHGSQLDLINAGLGVSADKVAAIKNAGLRVMPRLHGSPLMTMKGLIASLDALDAKLKTETGFVPPVLPGQKAAAPTPAQPTIIIFDGDTVPGYRDLLPELAKQFDARGLVFGAVEFTKQKGSDDFGRLLKGRLVRVHSISAEELGTLKPKEAVQRFGLAAKDRNIRVLFVRLPATASATTRLDAATTYVKAIKTEIEHSGLQVAATRGAHPFPELAPPAPLLALLFVGAGAALFLWLLTILPSALPRLWLQIGYVLLGLGVLKALVLATVLPDLGRAGFGLLAAIFFPLLALTWVYRSMERPAVKPLAYAIRALLIATAITVGGGLLIAAMLSATPFLVKVGQFAGVKLALAAPLLLFGLLLITDGIAREGETLAAYGARCRDNLCSFLAKPIYLWGIGIAAVGLVIVALMLARSGNDAGVGVSNSEMFMRSHLERWLVARPRTKEFLIGHPLFLIGMVAAARRQRVLAGLFMLGGAIGQVDVLNTFCHAHTPVLLSLLRVVNGLWLGTLIGVVVLLVFWPRGVKAEASEVKEIA